MAYKVFSKSNYFVIVDDNNNYIEDLASSVLITKATTSSTKYNFKLLSSESINNVEFADILDESGIAYADQATFETWYQQYTGLATTSTGGGGGGSSNPNGQATMANSSPVVIASNQSAVPTTINAGSNLIGKVGIDQTTNGTTNRVNIGADGQVALNGVEYFFSTVNTTSAQLASGATFTGTIEDVTTYPSISFQAFADQNLTITINQFIDLAGTKVSEVRTISYVANEKMGVSFTINGNYIQVIVKNEGASTTTTLQVESAYGIIDSNLEQKDDYLIGQSAQTATVNNILTPVSSSSSIDVTTYRSFAVQVVSTGTAGTFIFEGSNDGINFQSVPVYNQALVVRVPIVTAITATVSNIIYEGSCNFKYLRLRIATTITGGSIRAYTTLIHSELSTSVQTISNGTAANLLATVSGSVTATGVAGTATHSSAVSGNPVYGAGKALPTTIATVDTTLVAGDTAGVPITTGQQLAVKPFGTAELDYNINFSSISTTTTVQQLVPTSGTASVRNYITSLNLHTDAIGTAGVFWVLDSIVSVTSIAITTGLATTGTHDLKVGDAVVFTALAAGTGVSTNTVYYVTSVGSATTFNFSATLGGSNVVPSVAYTGTTMYRVLYQQKLQTAGIVVPTTITFPTPLKGIANTACNLLFPTSLTSGSVYLTVNGYRGF